MNQSPRNSTSFSMGGGYHSTGDEPPNSRLFILSSPSLTEEDFRGAFQPFGNIEEVRLVKNRRTGENKGVAYVKFSKTTDAARALETLNGQRIGNVSRAIKVIVAASRDEGAKRQMNEEEKTLRLFVLVPKTMTEMELKNAFSTFGDIDQATIIRDKATNESKGYAYVKYFKFTHAAAAFEGCDRRFKAVFAEPRDGSGGGGGGGAGPRMFGNVGPSMAPFGGKNMPMKINGGGGGGTGGGMSNDGPHNRLIAFVSSQLNEDQVWRLFDIVPGMDYCQLHTDGSSAPGRAIAHIVYTSPQSAAHAREKLHGFEYPPGCRLIVKTDLGDGRQPFIKNDNSGGGGGGGHLADSGGGSTSRNTELNSGGQSSDILHIAEKLVQATNIIQAAGLSPDILHNKLKLFQQPDEINCNVKLPEQQNMADINAEQEARCFIVCSPHALPNQVLRNVFCRFGYLIEVYMLANRKCGFAKFSKKESADSAISTLHGAIVNDVRLKVMEAEEQESFSRKRQKLDETVDQAKQEFTAA